MKGPHPIMRTSRRRAPLGRAAAATAATAAVLAAACLLSGCSGSVTGAQPSRITDVGPIGAPVSGGQPGTRPEVGRAGKAAPAPQPAALPGLGPRTLASIPSGTRQVVLVSGAGHDSATSTVTLFRRDPVTGWTAAGPSWKAHNAARGWTDDHHTGDLRSPVGVFALTDAGGRLPDPGAKLPYDHAPIGFTIRGTGVDGEPLRGAFDYVIAINYNRKPGTSPRDWTRPMGESRGGGIWLHVDHGGPTEGCVSLPAPVMRTLLRTLDPALHPVVVMGDAASLSR